MRGTGGRAAPAQEALGSDGSCWGQSRKPAGSGPGSPWYYCPCPAWGHLANAVPNVLRATGAGAGREGCPGWPHPKAGAAAGCTAWDRAAAGGLAEVPAAPAPALPQGAHALLSQVRCSGVWGAQGNV